MRRETYAAQWISSLRKGTHKVSKFGTYRAPATKPSVWFQWVEPISKAGSVTLNPNSQPHFQKFFTHSFTQVPVEAAFFALRAPTTFLHVLVTTDSPHERR